MCNSLAVHNYRALVVDSSCCWSICSYQAVHNYRAMSWYHVDWLLLISAIKVYTIIDWLLLVDALLPSYSQVATGCSWSMCRYQVIHYGRALALERFAGIKFNTDAERSLLLDMLEPSWKKANCRTLFVYLRARRCTKVYTNRLRLGTSTSVSSMLLVSTRLVKHASYMRTIIAVLLFYKSGYIQEYFFVT